jgi:hypothetical protein
MIEMRESVQCRDGSVDPLNKPFRVPIQVCLSSILASFFKLLDVYIVLCRIVDVFWIIFEIDDLVKNGK